jgi:hypothetical protein
MILHTRRSRRQHTRTCDTSTCEKMTSSRAAVVVIVVIETALCIPQNRLSMFFRLFTNPTRSHITNVLYCYMLICNAQVITCIIPP